MTTLDYEKKIWGSRTASLSIFNGYYLPLKYGLKSIAQVRGKILDFGCGAGAFTAALKRYRPDLDFVGLDSSKRCIQIAKKRRQGVKFIRGSISEVPFRDKSFEAVIANHLIEHLSEPEEAVGEIYRVLKPKGVFYSSTPLEGNWSSLVKWLRAISQFRKNRLKYLGHEQAFSQKDYLKLLVEADFGIKNINWSGHLTYQMIDTVYYPLLQILGKKPEYLAEVDMLESDKKAWQLIYTFGKGLTNLISNLESLLLGKFPGFIIHLKAVK